MLAESLSRRAMGDEFTNPEHRPEARAAILIERLDVLLKGPQGETLARLGLAGNVKQAYLHLKLSMDIFKGGLSLDSARLLQTQIRDLAYELRTTANKVADASRADDVSRRSQ